MNDPKGKRRLHYILETRGQSPETRGELERRRWSGSVLLRCGCYCAAVVDALGVDALRLLMRYGVDALGVDALRWCV